VRFFMPEPTVIVQAEFSARLSPEERRNATRYFCSCPHPVHLLVRPGASVIKGIISDISAQGIGLLIDRPLRPGTVLVVHLRRDRPSLLQTARVIHSRALPDGAWSVGCELTIPLPEKDLRSLVQETGAESR
jgi:hypothetical protein